MMFKAIKHQMMLRCSVLDALRFIGSGEFEMLNERYTSANSARIASCKCVGLMVSSLLLSIPALGHAEMGFASESYQDSDGGRFEHVSSREFLRRR